MKFLGSVLGFARRTLEKVSDLRDTITIYEPDINVRQPALGRGGLTVLGVLVIVGFARQLGVDPNLLLLAVSIGGPMVAAKLIQMGVFSPATVALMFEKEQVKQ
jgi:hypothetical protein